MKLYAKDKPIFFLNQEPQTPHPIYASTNRDLANKNKKRNGVIQRIH